MTRTTSPGLTSSARRSAVASTEPGARTGSPGRRAWMAAARSAAEAMVVSGSRPAHTSAIATASALDEDVGELGEHRRGPVEGQRLVDGPDAAAGFALADGGESLADGRRVVAIVVVHDDPGRLALALQPASDAGERRQVGGDRRQASGRGRTRPPRPRGRSRRCGGRRSRGGSSSGRPAGRGRGAPGSCSPGRWRSPGRAAPWPGCSRSNIARRSPGRSRPAVVAPGRRARRRGSCRASRQAGRGPLRRRDRRRWRRPWLPAAPGAATTRRSPRPPPDRRRRPDGPTRRWSGSPARDGRHRSCRRTRRPRRRRRRPPPPSRGRRTARDRRRQ